MRAVLTTLAVLAGVWLVLVLAAWGLQRQLIYLPSTQAPELPAHVDIEELAVTTADGIELTAWLVPAEQAVSTVLVLPGNAGDRSLRLPLAEGLVDRGHRVVLVDYRGFGGNPGHPSEQGLLADARAVRQAVAARDEVEAERLVYLGESIGTGVAGALAAEAPPAALVLRSPFPELAAVGATHYPFLPVSALLRDRYELLEHLEGYTGPLLVVAGGDDTIVPTEMSVEVAEARGARYVELPGVDHNDRELLDGTRYLDAVDEHVREHVGDE